MVYQDFGSIFNAFICMQWWLISIQPFQRKLESLQVPFDSWHFSVRSPIHNKFENKICYSIKNMDFSGQISDFIKKWLRHTAGPRLRTAIPVEGCFTTWGSGDVGTHAYPCLLNLLLPKLKMKIRTSYVAVSGTPANPGCTVHGLTQGEVRYLQVFT